ncbi:MAG: NAD(P)-dependent oxidoreductase [Comamonadaceae bacterium]|nr:MAG: NAD(P)-dependent oxidoreductase [Comamonadaceae bacterium]
MQTLPTIGFLGLGQMGAAMAERLVDAGYSLQVFDPNPSSVEPFVRRGAVAHPSPASVADAAAIVLACLPSQDVSRQAAYGPDGVASGSAIRIYAEMSTIGKETIEDIANALRARGIDTVDAPITGGAPGARAGTLAMLVSGAAESIAAMRPLLKVIGKEVYVMGEQPGMAQVMKLLNNLVMATNTVAAAEGLVFGAKAGLDPDMVLQVLEAGTGASYAASRIMANAVAGVFHYGAAISIISKDVSVGVHEASLLGVDMPVIAKARDAWNAAAGAGRGRDDFTTILKVIEEPHGVTVRGRPA